MSIGGSLIGNIGDNLFGGIGIDLDVLLALHGEQLSATRNDPTSKADRYGEPLNPPNEFPVTVLIGKQWLDDVPTLAGGRRKENLILIGKPGTMIEFDVVTYGGHKYDVLHVGRTTVQSNIAAEVYKTAREVDV